jgi:5-methylcytosine-specific restriction endonuclease McrA
MSGWRGAYRGKVREAFYGTPAWRRVRLQALARDQHMCRDCMERFLAGQMVRLRRLDLDNLRSLCAECHERRHPEKQAPGKIEAGPRAGMRIIRV